MLETSFDEDLPLWNRHFWVLAAIALAILFVNLGVGDLSGYDDAFFAGQGRAILQSGDWWTIRHNGFHNPQFPPLFFWLEALSMKAWGVNDFAAKFPSALLGLGTIIAVYFIAYDLTGQIWLALISMAVLMTTQYFMKYATHAMTDVPFAFFITAAVLFYLKGFRRPSVFLLSGLMVGLAMLTRPLVGVIPLIMFLVHLLWVRRSDLLRSRYMFGAVGLALVFPAIWYGIQYRLHGTESVAGPVRLIFQQAASGKTPDVIPFLKGLFRYPQLLLKLYWPWLPFMAVGLYTQARGGIDEKDQTRKLLLAWTVCILVPFSLGSAKQLRYVMAVFPAFAILAAFPIHRWIPAPRRAACFHCLYILGIAVVLFMHFFPQNRMRATDMRRLAPIAAANSRPDQRVVLYTEGYHQWDYQNQLIWYSNRNTEFAVTLEEVLDSIKADPGTPVIMDKESFSRLVPLTSPLFHLVVLGESERFICFRPKAANAPPGFLSR